MLRVGKTAVTPKMVGIPIVGRLKIRTKPMCFLEWYSCEWSYMSQLGGRRYKRLDIEK